MALYKNKEESLIKISITVDLQCVHSQCIIFWITFSVRVDLQSGSGLYDGGLYGGTLPTYESVAP